MPLSMLQSIALADSAGLAKLYDAVAEMLQLDTPSVDFAHLSAEARELEAKHDRAAARMPVIENPRVLCAASAHYAQPQYGFDKDVAIVEKHFPGSVTVDRALTSVSLLDLLTCVNKPTPPPRSRNVSINSAIDLNPAGWHVGR